MIDTPTAIEAADNWRRLADLVPLSVAVCHAGRLKTLPWYPNDTHVILARHAGVQR